MVTYEDLKNNFFFMTGPNVIESEEQIMFMAGQLKAICEKHNLLFVFKTSIDKANRSSLSSYRGLGFEEGIRILKKVKDTYNIPIITDIHESYQAELLKDVVDIIQIPAFLCRQTDLLEAAAKTQKIIHVKKGQFCSSEQMHKCKEKINSFGNNKVLLCERGSFFGYNDLIVDTRNLVWLKSDTNLVTMDITHCLQQPSQQKENGLIESGGLREMIPYMAKIAMSMDVNGIFMEVHNEPDASKCDAPTQWPLNKFEEIIELKNKYYHKDKTNEQQQKEEQKETLPKIVCCIPARLQSSRLPKKLLKTINGKSILEHVYNNVKQSKYIDQIEFLTDSEEIKSNIGTFHANCTIISEECINGTDRIIKYLSSQSNHYDTNNTIIVNVQGDEPFINHNHIDSAIENYLQIKKDKTKESNKIVCSTLYYKTNKMEEINSPNRGKCVLDKDSNIMYCSRSPIPVNKNGQIIEDYEYKVHIGIFVYDLHFLMEHYANENTPLQLCQDIEWLKIMEKGYKINAVEIKEHEIGIDTMEDYIYLKTKYEKTPSLLQ